MNKKYFFFAAIIVLVVSATVAQTVHAPVQTANVVDADALYPRASVTIGGKAFQALVSSTEALRDKGLGQRDSLDTDKVMLFIFDAPDLLGFWMKDMRFSIDMMWLDAQGVVVSIENNVSPDTYPKVYFPTKPSLYVIETNAGVLQSVGVKVGDKVTIAQK
jgi:hypothetical protein